uniref:Uncharacterized protein n=1 Tax=Rhizophora mucronata TaxID=61149 RepID=A0A2P2Q7I9_RHIMU
MLPELMSKMGGSFSHLYRNSHSFQCLNSHNGMEGYFKDFSFH